MAKCTTTTIWVQNHPRPNHKSHVEIRPNNWIVGNNELYNISYSWYSFPKSRPHDWPWTVLLVTQFELFDDLSIVSSASGSLITTLWSDEKIEDGLLPSANFANGKPFVLLIIFGNFDDNANIYTQKKLLFWIFHESFYSIV